MDNPQEDTERELQALRPRPPSAALWQRIERDLADSAAAQKPRYRSATTLTSWKWAGWQIAAAAAAVAILTTAGVMRLVSHPTGPEATAPVNVAVTPGTASPQMASAAPSVASDLYRPVKATNLLYDMADEGLVRLDNDLEARRTRYRFVDTITWKNQSGNATVRWSIPREEVRFIPVSQN